MFQLRHNIHLPNKGKIKEKEHLSGGPSICSNLAILMSFHTLFGTLDGLDGTLEWHDDVGFVKKNLFFGWSLFASRWVVYQQIYCIWSLEIPHVVLQKPMYSLQATVWWCLWRVGISASYFFFFENDNGLMETPIAPW